MYKFNILHKQNTVVKMKGPGCHKLDFPIVGGDPKIRAKNRHKIQQMSYVNIGSREELNCVDPLNHPIVIFPLISFLKIYMFIIPKKIHYQHLHIRGASFHQDIKDFCEKQLNPSPTGKFHNDSSKNYIQANL